MEKKGFAAFVIILIVVIALAIAGGILYYTKKPTALAPTSSNAGWQSYSDVADGITFQYPPIVTAPTPSSTQVDAEGQTSIAFYGGWQANKPQMPELVLTVIPSATGTLGDFEAQLKQAEPSPNSFHPQSINVDGEDAAIISETSTAAEYYPSISSASLFFFHNQKQYLIKLLTLASSSISPQGILLQIANSVQFAH